MTSSRESNDLLTALGVSRSFVAQAAGVVAAITIVLYQGWLMPFFQPFFAGRVGFARIVFYSLYGALLLVSAIVFGTRADVRRRVMPLAAVAAFGLAATALHPIGQVTRAYIIAAGMGGATIVLMQGSSSSALLRLAAAVTALNGALCFVDLPFADGFTTTVGRAAGLAINPNVAAAGILLGAAASHRAVPARLRPSFLVLTAGSLAVTLSRSAVLIAAAAASIAAGAEIWWRARSTRRPHAPVEGVGAAAFLAIGMVAWVSTATITNHHLRRVVDAVVVDSVSFVDALDAAHDFVARTARDVPSASAAAVETAGSAAAATAALATPAAAGRLETDEAAVLDEADHARIAALDERLSDEGVKNSISARFLFLERAMLAYRHNGFFGIGLEAAHPLVPHNTFLLFALAFGHPGWFIPLALVAVTFSSVRDPRDLPLPVAMVGLMTVSHDILLTPSLFLPIAIGIGGMMASHPARDDSRRGHRSVAVGSVAAVALFVIGCCVILRSVPSLTIERISPAAILEYRGAYLVNVPAQTFPGLFVTAIGAAAEDTSTVLREGSRPLRRVAWDSSAYPAVGPGEYAIQEGMLVFAASDAGDPRTGRQVIEFEFAHTIGWPLYALLLTLAAWCAAVLASLGRRNAARTVTEPEAVF